MTTKPLNPDPVVAVREERERVGHILEAYLKTIESADLSRSDKDFAVGIIEEIKRQVRK